jgi:multiple sugar transport system permease protein
VGVNKRQLPQWRNDMKNDMKVKWAFMLPFMIPLLLFWIIPLGSAFFISLTDWDYISPTFNLVGLENYVYMLTDPDFIEALMNTVYFSVTTIVGTIVLGLVFALMFQKKSFRRGSRQLLQYR